jgi:hypothetical protein
VQKSCESNNGATRDTARLAGMLPLTAGNDTPLKDFMFNELIFLLKKQIFYLLRRVFG